MVVDHLLLCVFLLGVLMVAGVWAEAMAWVQTRLTSNFTTVI